MKLSATLLAFMLGIAPAAATAPHASLPPALARAVAAFDRAQVEGDGAALQRLLADDYVLFNSRARVEHEVVRHWPGGAVLGGVATLEGSSDGKPFKARLRFADIWRERDGRWQVIFTQATRVATP